ncbi:MAG: DoxD-like family protein [Deltaproteobacteria bacterium]|nr:DoxD-like family protein [Deltaproteobacteria bacterium]
MSISHLLRKSFNTDSINHVSGDWALLFARVFFGLSMALAHGMNKLPPSDKFVSYIAKLGFPLPELFALQAGISECVGGLLIAIGLATRLSAFTLIFTMFVAVFLAHADDPYKKMELGLCYLFAFGLFMTLGGGRFSLDHLLFNTKK